MEAVEAPEGTNLQLLREELGDVLLQVLFHADIAAAEPGGFTIEEVIEGLDAKLHDRHPNVFSDSSDESRMTAAEQQVFWDELKKTEKSDRGPLDGIPPHLPALALAEKTIAKARKADIVLPPEPVSLDDDLPFTYSEEEFGELLFRLCAARGRMGWMRNVPCAPIPASLLSTTNSLVTAEAGRGFIRHLWRRQSFASKGACFMP